jgi:general secretion pathway protein D
MPGGRFCRFLGVAALAAAVLIPLRAEAAIVSVDGPVSVTVGDTFSVGIAVTGAGNLFGFEFDLDFDPAVVRATGIVSGGFLPVFMGILPPIVVESDVTGSNANYAEVAIGLFGTPVGDGILATIQFEALATGVSALTLNDVVLSAPLGGVIAVDSLVNGSVDVAGVIALPEPATVLVLAIGLLGLGLVATGGVGRDHRNAGAVVYSRRVADSGR